MDTNLERSVSKNKKKKKMRASLGARCDEVFKDTMNVQERWSITFSDAVKLLKLFINYGNNCETGFQTKNS